MSTEEVEKKKYTRITIILVVFLAVAIGLVVFFINLFNPKSTYTSSGSEVTTTASLYCTTKSKNIPDAFFDMSDAESASQIIKVIFKNKKIDNISYNADAIYDNKDKAKNEEAKLHYKYASYVQDDGKNIDVFSPNFSANENGIKISLYADKKQLNNTLAKIFLIDTSDTSLDSYTSKVLSTLYKTKGFTCESKE